jgi:SAM-dependent methyltransferase
VTIFMSTIQSDFDRIAALSDSGWNHNSLYHAFLLRALPAYCPHALEIGCGTGAFARLLAARSGRVLALDLSPCMIEVARASSPHHPNIDFQVADVLAWDFPAGHFDAIATITTLHHLPLETTLSKMKAALKVGGVLVVLDLYKVTWPADLLTAALAIPASLVVEAVKNGRLRQSPAAQAAWDEHGRHDSYLTMAEIRRSCARILPGAQVKKHLFWRYSVVWKKTMA